MKKEVLLFAVLVISMTLVFPMVMSANDTQVNKAYDCLEKKIEDRTCSSLGMREKIFSLLAVGECESELRDASKDNECWPKENCDVKTTAQAVLALGGSDKAETWLLSQKKNTDELIWYLQTEITSEEESTCTISYDGTDYPINIGEDKKISSNAGSCLTLAVEDYWLEVSPSCYGKEFKISCDKSFFTNLLFRIEDSSTIHVLDKVSSASEGGTTLENINSSCFAKAGSCTYEGTLWAALVLDYLGKDVSSCMPYLIAMADKDENEKYLPESFLYLLTDYSDFRNSLLSKQIADAYWEVSGNRYYDTALALYSLASEELSEKTDAENWLLEVQDKDGCWNSGSILDTAFILYSVWQRTIGDGGGEVLDCISSGYYCMSEASCEGVILEDYYCSGILKCCDTPKTSKTCEDLGGKICGSDEACTSSTVSASDTDECCLDDCKKISEVYDCELYDGVCEIYECGEGYEQTSLYTCEYGDICCIPTTEPEPKGRLWIWILLILIVLVILAIIFRNKLKMFWFRIKPKKSKPSRPGPGFPPMRPMPPHRRIMPRRILPSAHTHPRPAPRKPTRTHRELDEVLKKLKEMGK